MNELNELFTSHGITQSLANVLDNVAALIIVLCIAFLADVVCRKVLLRAVEKVVKKTKATWDDIVFHPRVMRRLGNVVAPVIVFIFLPVILDGTGSFVSTLITRLFSVYLLYLVLRFVNAFLHAVYEVYSDMTSLRDRPLKGLLQTGQIIIWFVGLIAAVSLLIDKSLLTLLAGLGASAAVLMLIFKDSIVGLVAGIQLSANDMLRVGDWIQVPGSDVDGEVIEVSLITVKVRNWDKTIVTVPPYNLVSGSFINWRGMKESGGRRVKRYLCIDMNTVRFATPEMLDFYRQIPLLSTYMEQVDKAANQDDKAANRDDKADADPAGAQVDERPTNLGALRAYILAYLKQSPLVNTELSCMVRQLQPTEHGIPIELYFFTRDNNWAPYEDAQSYIFDYLLSVVPQFGLRVFQLPTGRDFNK